MPRVRKTYTRRGAYGQRKAYRGKGGYVADSLKGLGAKGGQFLGNALGKIIEKFTGLGKYRGKGAYHGRGAYPRATGYGRRMIGGGGAYRGRGSYNEVSNGELAPLPPQFSTRNNADYVEIAHREYIGDLYSSGTAGALTITSFYINPSDFYTFPWLNDIASIAFQQYEMMGCIFEFKSMSADALNSTNTALDSVVAAVNYDSTDAVPTTRAQMENTDWSQAFKPSQSFLVPVECARKETFGGGLLYTRTSQTIPSGQDRRLYDLARLDIASLGMQGTSVNLGSLYVTYKVRLYKKIMLAPNVLSGYYHTWNNNAVIAAGTVPIGTAATDTVIHNNSGFVHATGTQIQLPVNNAIPNSVWRIDIFYYGTSTTVTAPTVTFSGSLASINNAGSATASQAYGGYSNTAMTNALSLMIVDYFQVSATPTAVGVIAIGVGGTFPGGTVGLDIQITQLPGTYNLNI